MSTLDIDFGSPRRSARHYAGWALLLLAAGLVGYEAWCYGRYTQTRHSLESERDRLQVLLTGAVRPASSAASAPSKDGFRRAAQAADRINAPWDRLFESVEAAMDGQTALLGMEPDFDRREVTLRVEAKDMDGMLSYLKRIDAASGLSGAYLDTHQMQLRDPQRPVRFTVVARWAAQPSPVDATATREKHP